jgi:hypothetical protein
LLPLVPPAVAADVVHPAYHHRYYGRGRYYYRGRYYNNRYYGRGHWYYR